GSSDDRVIGSSKPDVKLPLEPWVSITRWPDHPISSSWHAQYEIASDETEDQVWRPGRDRGWQLTQIAHCLKKARDRPIDNADADGGRQPCHCGALTGGKREGNGEHGHHQRDQRVGNFLLQLHPQAHHVEAALL